MPNLKEWQREIDLVKDPIKKVDKIREKAE